MYIRKKLFFNFLSANFLVPKSGHQLEKRPVLGPTHGFSTFFLGATHNSICSRKYVIWRFISTTTPFSRTSWRFLWTFFASHLVSTTCRLTKGIGVMQLESVQHSLHQKQSSRGVLRKMCSENMHAVNFIYRRAPMPTCNLLNSHFDMGVLL